MLCNIPIITLQGIITPYCVLYFEHERKVMQNTFMDKKLVGKTSRTSDYTKHYHIYRKHTKSARS